MFQTRYCDTVFDGDNILEIVRFLIRIRGSLRRRGARESRPGSTSEPMTRSGRAASDDEIRRLMTPK